MALEANYQGKMGEKKSVHSWLSDCLVSNGIFSEKLLDKYIDKNTFCGEQGFRFKPVKEEGS